MKKFEIYHKKAVVKTAELTSIAVSYIAIARDEDRALELLSEIEEHPDDFIIEETIYHKDQLGRDYPEKIEDVIVY